MVTLRSKDEVDKIRHSAQIVAGTLQLLKSMGAPGVDTGDMDKKAEEFIRDNGGEPSFLGYHGFPASTCISINEEVVHGIPGRRIIQEGDIVGVDVGVYKNGYHGDAALSFPIGEVSERAKELLKVTEESLLKGIEAFRPGNTLGDVGHAVQSHGEKHGFGIVRSLVGHGIGTEMHEDPQVPNYGKPGSGLKLRAGMVCAIEPMLTVGDHDVKTLSDHWTIVTRDGSLACHFEHTVALTENGPEILSVVPTGEKVSAD
ncbi:MAG: type I methionyl aminopeptidase [Candidatus Eisenbacteria bacterium]|uniref:Methionine aminopeptidase n=1 Tax=Eiseniibacteriota bacterium TaxID=2212470 RepID=A0A7Y2E4Q0_UNCEI|nr:type I methionyl aminopeptidase [Candidatus Eisenbacteria bacterium]